MWMLMCRQAVVQCKAVSALWTLWEDMKASLDSEVNMNDDAVAARIQDLTCNTC